MKNLGLVLVMFAASLTSCDNGELNEVVNQVVSRSITEETEDTEAPEGDGSKSTIKKEDPKYPRWKWETDEAYWRRVSIMRMKEIINGN